MAARPRPFSFLLEPRRGRLNDVQSPLRGSERKNDACGHALSTGSRTVAIDNRALRHSQRPNACPGRRIPADGGMSSGVPATQFQGWNTE